MAKKKTTRRNQQKYGSAYAPNSAAARPNLVQTPALPFEVVEIGEQPDHDFVGRFLEDRMVAIRKEFCEMKESIKKAKKCIKLIERAGFTCADENEILEAVLSGVVSFHSNTKSDRLIVAMSGRKVFALCRHTLQFRDIGIGPDDVIKSICDIHDSLDSIAFSESSYDEIKALWRSFPYDDDLDLIIDAIAPFAEQNELDEWLDDACLQEKKMVSL